MDSAKLSCHASGTPDGPSAPPTALFSALSVILILPPALFVLAAPVLPAAGGTAGAPGPAPDDASRSANAPRASAGCLSAEIRAESESDASLMTISGNEEIHGAVLFDHSETMGIFPRMLLCTVGSYVFFQKNQFCTESLTTADLNGAGTKLSRRRGGGRRDHQASEGVAQVDERRGLGGIKT